jgi:hypothetical protein
MCCKAKIAAFLVLLVFAIPATEAADEESDVPRAVKGYALQLEAECTPGFDSGAAGDMGTSPSKLIKLAAHGPKRQIFVAYGAATRCGDTGPLCGTGGCPIGVFPVKDGVTTNYYDDQALGWKITRVGPSR